MTMRKYGALNTGAVNNDISASGAGSSSADSNHPVRGNVKGVYVEPNLVSEASPTITVESKSDPPYTILSVATDVAGWYFPRTPVHDPANGNVIANIKSDGVPVADTITVTITNGYDGDNFDVWLLLE